MERRRTPQEQEGNYMFNGDFFVSKGVSEKMDLYEIMSIYQDIQDFVQKKNGIDCLQVFENSEGEQLIFIDQLSKEMVLSADYPAKYNYCLLMFAYEY